jgi:hypothetical protein
MINMIGEAFARDLVYDFMHVLAPYHLDLC